MSFWNPGVQSYSKENGFERRSRWTSFGEYQRLRALWIPWMTLQYWPVILTIQNVMRWFCLSTRTADCLLMVPILFCPRLHLVTWFRSHAFVILSIIFGSGSKNWVERLGKSQRCITSLKAWPKSFFAKTKHLSRKGRSKLPSVNPVKKQGYISYFWDIMIDLYGEIWLVTWREW